MKLFILWSYISLFLIISSCSPKPDNSTHHTIFTIDINNLPAHVIEKIRKNTSKEAFSIGYIPIPEKNLQENISIIKNTVFNNQWSSVLPKIMFNLGIETADIEKYPKFPILTQSLEPVHLNFSNKNYPVVSFTMILKEMSVSRSIQYQSVHRNISTDGSFNYISFISDWNTREPIIPVVAEFFNLDSIKPGSKIYVLLVHIVSITHPSTNSAPAQTEYYLNPINMDALCALEYLVL